MFALSLITGRVQLYRSDADSAAAVPACSISLRAHTESCRSIAFAADGRLLLTASADCSVLAVDAESGKAVSRLKGAHAAPLSGITTVQPWTFATADDAGLLKLWDMRQRDATCSEQAHRDFVSDMVFESRRQSLLSVSGDGTLSVFDLRSSKVRASKHSKARGHMSRLLQCGRLMPNCCRGAAMQLPIVLLLDLHWTD